MQRVDDEQHLQNEEEILHHSPAQQQQMIGHGDHGLEDEKEVRLGCAHNLNLQCQLVEKQDLRDHLQLQLHQEELIDKGVKGEHHLLDDKKCQPMSSTRCRLPDSLLPGLPNPVAVHCLARIPCSLYPYLKAVSTCWREALSSPDIYSTRKELRCTENWIYLSFSPRTLNNDRVKNWIEAYDPVRNTWKPICWLPGLADSEMLKGFGLVSLHGRLYIIGWRLCTRTSTSPVEVDVQIRADVMMYDCFANKWSVCAKMSTPRVDFAWAVCKGRIYVMGGRSVAGHEKGVSSAEVYDIEADAWYPLPKMSTNRYKCVGVTFKDKVFAIGGFTSSENPQEYSLDAFALNRSSVEIYDPAIDGWEFVKGMWQLDVPPYQVVNLEGQLYSSGDVLNSWKGHLEIYDEALNMWKAVPGSRREDLEGEGLLALRRYVTMAPIGNHIFFLEGYCQPVEHPSFCFDRVCSFNAAGNLESAAKWEAFEPLHNGCRDLCSHCCVVEM